MRWTVASLLAGPVAPLGDVAASGIAKHALQAPCWLGRSGLEGDAQADTRRHGGPAKALHHYALEHYTWWIKRIGMRASLARAGAFGENLSTIGCTEADLCIGDVLALGDAMVQVSQSRQPCWKLNLRFAEPAMAALVQRSGRTGWYYRVLAPGWVAPGDALVLLERAHPAWPLSRIIAALYDRDTPPQVLVELSGLAALPSGWRDLFARRLARGQTEDWTERLSGPTGKMRGALCPASSSASDGHAY